MTKDNVKLIDAKGRALGRVASAAAHELTGKKSSPDFDPSVYRPRDVKIINVSLIKVTGTKLKNKFYYRYSGYPSGLKKSSFEEEFKKSGANVMRRAVWGMLPKNKSRKRYIKHLAIED